MTGSIEDWLQPFDPKRPTGCRCNWITQEIQPGWTCGGIVQGEHGLCEQCANECLPAHRRGEKPREALSVQWNPELIDQALAEEKAALATYRKMAADDPVYQYLRRAAGLDS